MTKLFVVEDNKARAINDIETGTEGQGWVEVTSKDLPASATVVTTGQTQLADGTPVVVRTPEPPAEHGHGRSEAVVSRQCAVAVGSRPVVSGRSPVGRADQEPELDARTSRRLARSPARTTEFP